MMDPASESKRLAIHLREKDESFVTGMLDLNETLDQTDQLYTQLKRKNEGDKITANEIMPDSQLMKIQAGLAKRSAKLYKPDSLVFNPVEFSKKLKLYYDQSSMSQSETQSSQRECELLWLHLGIEARKLLYTVPSFNFIHGTFDPDPVEVVKKKRKMKEKDKIGVVTKPMSMSLKESSDNKDMMVSKAERVLGILEALLKRKNEAVCFYEFVTDPSSFGRTIENIFVLSLLVNQNCVRIVKDRNGLPCLLLVGDEEKEQRNPAKTKQCILTMTKEEWKDIVKTFRFKNALIPPQRTNAHKNGTL